jgi:DUF971 family protein
MNPELSMPKIATKAHSWPTLLRYHRNDRMLETAFESGEVFKIPAELLRVESPSAEVRGHGSQDKQIVAGKADVAIVRIEPVGRYAVRLIFSDGHDSGLYTWRYLFTLGHAQADIWQVYLQALREKGLDR